MTNRRSLVLSTLFASILLCAPLLGAQQAPAVSVGESLSYTMHILFPPEEQVWHYSFNTFGIVPTEYGPAYAVSGTIDHFSTVNRKLLLWRDVGFQLISVANSKLLSHLIDSSWYDRHGNVIQHRVVSIGFNYIGDRVIVDCAAYMLSPEAPEILTAHFVASHVDIVTTQRTVYDFQFYGGDFKIGRTYRWYAVGFGHGGKGWWEGYDEAKIIGTTEMTVKAGTFLSYHFVRTTPYFNVFSDTYVMVSSKVLVYAQEPMEPAELELTEYTAGEG